MAGPTLDELLEPPPCAKCNHPYHSHAFNNDVGHQECGPHCGCPQYADPRQPQEPSLLLGANEAAVFAEYRAATIALRDAELAHKAAGDRYRVALTALNAAIAPVGA